MTDDARFWDKIAAKYAASPVKNEAAYAETLARTRAYLTPDAQVLELGCGTGTTALKLAAHVGHITATDISGEMIAIATAKAADAGIANAVFRRGDTSLEDHAAPSFDAVLAFNLLHLVRDLPAALTRIHAVLKPGGVFVSKTACLAQQTRLWAVPLKIMQVLGKAPFVDLMTFEDLDRAISQAGFNITETDVMPPPISRFVVARKA